MRVRYQIAIGRSCRRAGLSGWLAQAQCWQDGCIGWKASSCACAGASTTMRTVRTASLGNLTPREFGMLGQGHWAYEAARIQGQEG
jgi:hypothetical protein